MAKKKKNKSKKNKVTAKNIQAVSSGNNGGHKKLKKKETKMGKINGHAKHEISPVISPEPPKEKSPKIQLTEKIHLEKSSHTYRSFLQRRYGKYFKRVEKPARIVLKISIRPSSLRLRHGKVQRKQL